MKDNRRLGKTLKSLSPSSVGVGIFIELRRLGVGPPWELRHTLPPDTKGMGPAAQ